AAAGLVPGIEDQAGARSPAPVRRGSAQHGRVKPPHAEREVYVDLTLRVRLKSYNFDMARNAKAPETPTVTFWGAARSVTGSMHRLDVGGQALLLDCGLFQGPRLESYTRNREFPFRARDIDAVVLSHAHIDHCGNLPNLVRQGFTGPIY